MSPVFCSFLSLSAQIFSSILVSKTSPVYALPLLILQEVSVFTALLSFTVLWNCNRTHRILFKSQFDVCVWACLLAIADEIFKRTRTSVKTFILCNTYSWLITFSLVHLRWHVFNNIFFPTTLLHLYYRVSY